MHIVNAEFDYKDINDSVRMTELIHKIINVVRYQYHMNFDEDSLHFVRFVTHLKFFAKRLFTDTMLDGNDLDFQNLIRTQYQSSYECAEKIAKFIWDGLQQWELRNDHLLPLNLLANGSSGLLQKPYFLSKYNYIK